MGSRILSTAHGTHRGSFAAVDWALFAVVGTIWGSSFLFMAIGLEAFRPGLVTWLRILFGVAVLWVLPGARAARIDRADLGSVLLLAITWVVIPFTLFPLAQGSVNSAIAGMLNGAAPIFTAVVATILFRKAPGPRQLIGIPLGFLGVAAIALSAAGHGSSEALGVALILVATVCYGIAFNIAAPLQQKYGSLPVMARILAIGAVLTAPDRTELDPGVAVRLVIAPRGGRRGCARDRYRLRADGSARRPGWGDAGLDRRLPDPRRGARVGRALPRTMSWVRSRSGGWRWSSRAPT